MSANIKIAVWYMVGEYSRKLPADCPHGEFGVDRNELLMDFFKRVNMPVYPGCRIVFPEWGYSYSDLSGRFWEYDIRDGDGFYICPPVDSE